MFFSKMGTDSGLMSALEVSKLMPRRTMTSSLTGFGAGAPTEYHRPHLSPEIRRALQASGLACSFSTYQRPHLLACLASAAHAAGEEACGTMSGIGLCCTAAPVSEAANANIAEATTTARRLFFIR